MPWTEGPKPGGVGAGPSYNIIRQTYLKKYSAEQKTSTA